MHMCGPDIVTLGQCNQSIFSIEMWDMWWWSWLNLKYTDKKEGGNDICQYGIKDIMSSAKRQNHILYILLQFFMIVCNGGSELSDAILIIWKAA